MKDQNRRDWKAIETLLTAPGTAKSARLQAAMDYLQVHRADYHWVGIYELHGDVLELGPYAGPHTDHDRIPVGRGVCGTAVAENRNQIVDDVRALSNYLACNLETRSEIVVLVREPKTGQILGQIDVDGTRVKSFNQDEARFLDGVAVMLAPHLRAVEGATAVTAKT